MEPRIAKVFPGAERPRAADVWCPGAGRRAGIESGLQRSKLGSSHGSMERHATLMCRWDAVSGGCFDRGMPLKPREMPGGGIPGIGVPSWLILAGSP